MRLTIDQVAEAMELNKKGVYWGNIALMLNVSLTTLMRYIYAAEKYGYSFWDKELSDENYAMQFRIAP